MNRRGLRRGVLFSLAGVLTVCSAIVTMHGFASAAAALPEWFLASLGLGSTIVGFSLFVIVGGGYLTPSSVVFFGWAVLFGFPIAYLALDEAMPPEVVQAAISANCGVLALVLILPGTRPGQIQLDVLTGYLLRYRRSILTVALAAAVTFIATFDMPSFQVLSRRGLIACAFAIFSVGVALVSRRRRFAGGAAMSAALLLGGIWFRFGFTGFGRINVAAVGLAFLCIWTLWFPSTWTKIALVITVPIGLTWAGLRRTTGVVQEVWREGAGLESVMAPVMTYGELIGRGDEAGFWAWLEQGAASVFFWVPRSVWPSKAEGFGRLLVHELRPDLAHTGQSMAASWLGEGFAYLGPIGVLLTMVITVGLVKCLEWWFWRGAAGSTPRHLFYLILGAWGGVQLLSFMWGGGFYFTSRVGGLLFGLGTICLMIWLWRTSGLGRLGRQRVSYRHPFSLYHGASRPHAHGAPRKKGV